MNPTPTKNNGATDVAAPTAPNTEPLSISTLPPKKSAVKACAMPNCDQPAVGGIHCVQHQPDLFAKPIRELRAIRKNPDSTLVGFYDDARLFDQYARECNELGYSIYSPINPIKAEATGAHHAESTAMCAAVCW